MCINRDIRLAKCRDKVFKNDKSLLHIVLFMLPRRAMQFKQKQDDEFSPIIVYCIFYHFSQVSDKVGRGSFKITTKMAKIN